MFDHFTRPFDGSERPFAPNAENLKSGTPAAMQADNQARLKPQWRARTARALQGLKAVLLRKSSAFTPSAGLEHLKDAHWELTEREARLRELLDGQDALIVRRDGEGRVVFANRAYCDAFAITMRELKGRRFSPAVLATEHLAPAAGQRRRYIEHLETSAGLRFILWEEHTLPSPARSRDTQCTGRDITDERRAAAELNEARDAAEIANRAKSRFLASMSHEIRTPMNGILGMASLLQETKQSEEQQTYTRAIDQSARALLALIDEILDFSKIEAGKLSLAAEPFSLAACVRDALRLIEPKALVKGLVLSCNIAGGVPDEVIGDAPRVRQIVLNIVSNAIKFTDQGSVVVTVQPCGDVAAPTLTTGFEIIVKDTGVGISPETMDRLFVEFEQASAGNGQRHAGTGLGLAISRRLARAMGGDILAEGAPGQGAKFTARLRLPTVVHNVSVASGESTGVDRHTLIGRASGIADAPPRILVAEDNDINALLARRICERAGCAVEVASSGLAAVAAVERALVPGATPFDLILMDVFMPGLDGLDATRQIKALYRDRLKDSMGCPPIVALTANAFAEDRAHCLASGMDDYLAKPFDTRQLTDLLARWLPSAAESAG